MRTQCITAAALLVSALLSQAQTTNITISFTNKSGPHMNVQVYKVTDTLALWREADGGMGSVRLLDLPEEVRSKLGVDTDKAAKTEQAREVTAKRALERQAAVAAEIVKAQRWETFSLVSIESDPTYWPRQQWSVKDERGGAYSIVILNVPRDVADLPCKILNAQARMKAAFNRHTFLVNAINTAEKEREAAMSRYVYTSDDYTRVTSGSKGTVVDDASTRRAAPGIIQADINTMTEEKAALKVELDKLAAEVERLRAAIARTTLRLYFTGLFSRKLQVWDYAPKNAKPDVKSERDATLSSSSPNVGPP